MNIYKEFKKQFEEGAIRLTAGVAKLARRRGKNWYQKLKDVANALAGGNIPSFDPNISGVKSKTNIYSGPEAMNKSARSILQQTASEYSSIYTTHFEKFYITSELILKEKKGEDFSFDEIFSSDENLDRIKELYDRLNISNDIEGLLSSEAPRNLVIEIFKEMTIIISSLSGEVNKNASFIGPILIDLDGGEFSNRFETPLIGICKRIYIFKQLTSSFTMLQSYRKEKRKERALANPSGSRDTDTAEEPTSDDSGASPRLPITFDYSAEQLLAGSNSALEDLGGDSFRIQNLDRSGEYIIPVILARRDGEQVTNEEITLINDNSQQFIKKLISLDVLELNIEESTLLRNSNGGVASIGRDRSKFIFNIRLNQDFKTEAYNEVLNDNDSIFVINNTSAATPAGKVIKASLNSDLKKEAETATTPYYETISPSGERVSFTPTDLVKGMGKIKDSSGKSFKPKKIKGKTLADKVMSKGFGKVRK